MKSNALSQFVFWLSVVAVILALIGALGTDLWLASTQWVLVAAVMGIWAIFLKE
jgi:hypothetical protein